MIGRFCEEFHCLPSQAWREWERLPVGLMETILEMREFVRVKYAYDTTTNAAALPPGPLLDLIVAFDFETAAAELARRRG